MSSSPAGAAVLVDGMAQGSTPTMVTLRRKENHIVTLQLSGYETENVAVTHTLSGAVAGNLLLGGLIGWGVDATDGAQYKLLPDTISLNLRPRSVTLTTTAPYAAPQPAYVAVPVAATATPALAPIPVTVTAAQPWTPPPPTVQPSAAPVPAPPAYSYAMAAPPVQPAPAPTAADRSAALDRLFDQLNALGQQKDQGRISQDELNRRTAACLAAYNAAK